MRRYAFGEVILVPFPFTNQSGVKKRPAVVVSSRAYQAARPDLLILAITGRMRMPLGFGEALIRDWQAAGLLKPSVFKPVLTTVEQRLVLRGMGTLSPADQQTLRQIIGLCVG
jgi:mRNA interferase MazF